MKAQRPENPLALAMMAMLAEGPMHPYEIASTIRTRHGEDAIRIKFGSLYSVIAQLVERRWIVAHETAQSGRRPEHTKYRLTEEGRAALKDWMRDLLSNPVKEYPKFESALCLLAVLPREDILARIRERVGHLDASAEHLRAEIACVISEGLDPMFVVEADYRLAMLDAERAFCRQLIPKLRSRSKQKRARK